MYYQKRHPDWPWLTEEANTILDSVMLKSDCGVEMGSGRSTLWLSKRLGSLTSVEHNGEWFQQVQKMLNDQGVSNVSYHHCEELAEGQDPGGSSYVGVIDRFGPETLDFALVDGIYRDHCTVRLFERIRPGGLLVIDNIERYLPTDSITPDSRGPDSGYASELWEQAAQTLKEWRVIRTSSGVTDTWIFIKPAH